MMTTDDRAGWLRCRIRWLLAVFVAGLVLSGVTAFPLLREVEWLTRAAGIGDNTQASELAGMQHWLAFVRDGLRETYRQYPFIGYGTDWLAFGHLVIAVFFIGTLRDPSSNPWVITAGMLACVTVIPLALICGEVRGIPVGWRLIDCSFGVIGIVPLWLARKFQRELLTDSRLDASRQTR